MKTKSPAAIFFSALLLLALLGACAQAAPKTDDAVWDAALYREDTTVGEGAYTSEVTIVYGEHTITLTVKTDKTTLGAALSALGIAQGENGLYETVNGIYADYAADHSYWALLADGQMLPYGFDDASVTDGQAYTIEYTVFG